MKRKIEITKETIFPIIVFVLSILNILNNFGSISLSIILSFIGILGVVLFFKQNGLSSKLLYFWLIAQIIIIEPIFNLSQISFVLSFSVGLGNYALVISFLPILFLGLIKGVELSNLIGKRINLIEFRENVISESLPVTGIITCRVDFNENKNWLLVNLEKELKYEDKSITRVLIKNKENSSIKLKDKNQIAHFRLVINEGDIDTNDISKFPFIDWIRCY